MKVLVQSFSFKRTGYPADKTGKGGGFVFDCRAIDAYDYATQENPNAPFPHMHLTGLDGQISDTLDNDNDTQGFLQAAWVMVNMGIAKCLRRGFSIMTINFGCTAGQHRSVYLAECMARKINKAFPDIDVELNHLESQHWPRRN